MVPGLDPAYGNFTLPMSLTWLMKYLSPSHPGDKLFLEWGTESAGHSVSGQDGPTLGHQPEHCRAADHSLLQHKVEDTHILPQHNWVDRFVERGFTLCDHFIAQNPRDEHTWYVDILLTIDMMENVKHDSLKKSPTVFLSQWDRQSECREGGRGPPRVPSILERRRNSPSCLPEQSHQHLDRQWLVSLSVPTYLNTTTSSQDVF